ncbi:MAG: exported transglycosylase [Polyangiaceae bacterium]|jgi:soluble lytic murein transglycosylase|nr:exported transglycosylase [Polyangiaceae bacterium]
MGLVRAQSAALWVCLAACQSQPDSPLKASPSLLRSASSAQVASIPLQPEAPPPPWAEALRGQRYKEADRAFQALPADAQQGAEVRFAWARTRLELGQAAAAIPLLAGLDSSLPALASQLSDLRSQVLLAAGPAADAAKLLESRGDPKSLASASKAWLDAGDAEHAVKVAERGLASLGKGRGMKEREVALRFARGMAAEKLGRQSLWAGDFRFVALESPLSEEARTAVTKLAQLGDKSPLSPADRLARARALAAAGRVKDVESELSFIEPLAARVTRAGVPASLRGLALFNSRGDYKEAEQLFQKASELGTEDAAKELFYVARSRSRAQDDAGAEAGFRAVIQRFRTTPWAELSELSIARIFLAAGSYDKAAKAYGAYLQQRGGKARFFDDASYERAVALLAGGQAGEAQPLLSRLATRTKDVRFEAQLRELGAVALLGLGKREEAIKAFQEVIAQFPLSFPALAAAARLRALGSNLPAWMEPPSSGAAPSPLELKLPADVAVLHRLGLDGDAAIALSAQERRISRAHAPRSGEALCELYGLLEVADRRYAVGQDAATRLGLDRAPGPRSRWMWDCVYPRPYSELVTRAERELLLPRGVLWAVMRQESGFRAAVRSPVGAVGLLQLMPKTAERVAEELGEKIDVQTLTQAHASVRLGSHYLRKLIDSFDGNLPLALAAYNAGPQAVSRWLASGENLPLDLFVARIPYEETRGYVARVLANAARYAYLEGGEGAVQAPPLDLPKGVKLPENSY